MSRHANRLLRAGHLSSGTTTPPPTVTHGSQLTRAMVGHVAFYDSGLGRLITDADLTVYTTGKSASDFGGNGVIIEKAWFKNGFIPDRACVLRGCRFDYKINNYVYGLSLNLDYCTVISTPTAPSLENNALYERNLFINRCYIEGGSDGIDANNGGSIISESWVRLNTQAGDHNDCIQNDRGSGSLTVVRCNLDCRPLNLPGAYGNGCFQLADNGLGRTGTITLTDNYLLGGGYSMRCYDSYDYVVNGNWFQQDTWGYGPAITGGPLGSVTWGNTAVNQVVNPSLQPVASWNKYGADGNGDPDHSRAVATINGSTVPIP